MITFSRRSGVFMCVSANTPTTLLIWVGCFHFLDLQELTDTRHAQLCLNYQGGATACSLRQGYKHGCILIRAQQTLGVLMDCNDWPPEWMQALASGYRTLPNYFAAE